MECVSAQQPQGSFYHLHEWSGINQHALRNPSFNLIARAGGEIRGVLPLTLVASPLFGRVLCSMPFVNYGGPVVRRCDGNGRIGASGARSSRTR